MQQSATRDVHIESMTPLIAPIELVNELPIDPDVENTVLMGRKQVKKVLNAEDRRLMIVVGPCSIHDEEAALDYCTRLSLLSQNLSDRLLIIMRVYFEKPRTTVGWKGLIYDPNLNDTFDIEAGLKRARKLLLEIGSMGVYAGTEFLDPIVPQYLAGLVTWSTLGARTTESQTHRQMASGLSMPVGFKNGTDGNVQVAIDAMISAQSPHGFLGLDKEGRTAIVKTLGNPDGHLVLRGGTTGTNFHSESINQTKQQLNAADVRSQLLVDCSHGNSNKDHTKQSLAFKSVISQRISGNEDIIGCMIESHINPGNQKLGNDLDKLQYGVSVTDKCIGWEETKELLEWAYEEARHVVGAPLA